MEIQEAIDIRYEEIEGLQQKLTEDHYMNPEQEDELEELITKAIKFGELCAQRDAKAQVIPEGFEQAYSKIFSPIVKRPYPRLENSNYKYIEIDQGWKLWQAATAQAVSQEKGRTDFEIIAQTIELVDLIALSTNVFQRDPKSKVHPFESENPRVMEWWRTACQIQELLTNTDPDNCDFEEYKAMIEALEPAND